MPKKQSLPDLKTFIENVNKADKDKRNGKRIGHSVARRKSR